MNTEYETPKQETETQIEFKTSKSSAETNAKETIAQIKASVKADLEFAQQKNNDLLMQANAKEIKTLKEQNSDLLAEKESHIINQQLKALALSEGLNPLAVSDLETNAEGKFKLTEDRKIISATNEINSP